MENEEELFGDFAAVVVEEILNRHMREIEGGKEEEKNVKIVAKQMAITFLTDEKTPPHLKTQAGNYVEAVKAKRLEAGNAPSEKKADIGQVASNSALFRVYPRGLSR